MPNAGAPFLVVTLFSIVWYWNDYYFAQMMMASNPVLATEISSITNTVNTSQSATSVDVLSAEAYTVYTYAAALLFILPPLLLYLYLQKYFVQSIERTGIVG